MPTDSTSAPSESPARHADWVARSPSVASWLPWLAVLLAIGFRIASRSGTAPPGGFDERLYVLFASELRRGGIGALRVLLDKYPTDPTLSLGPLPLRIAYVAACALRSSFGGSGVAPLVWLSQASGIGTIVAGYGLARRWIGAELAPFVAMLIVVSPLGRALSGRALEDSFFTFWVLTTIYFFERTILERSRLDPVLFGLSFLVCLLSKESTVLLVPIFALASLRMPWIRASIPIVVASALAGLTLIWVRGGSEPLLETYRTYAHLEETIDYSNHFQRGPWFRYVVDLLLLSPASTMLALVGVMWTPIEQEQRRGFRRACLFAFGGLALFSGLPLMNVRFVLFVETLLRMVGVGGAVCLASLVRRDRRTLALTALLALTVAVDLDQFQRIFVVGGVYDPVTANLVSTDGLVR